MEESWSHVTWTKLSANFYHPGTSRRPFAWVIDGKLEKLDPDLPGPPWGTSSSDLVA